LAQLPNVIKISKRAARISYLFYPAFDQEAHPALVRSVSVDLLTRAAKTIDFSQSENPPILHRKETLVSADHPLYATFRELTQAEEGAGLLDRPAKIGFLKAWEALLGRRGFRIEGHRLLPNAQPELVTHSEPISRSVSRHKTAIARYEPSRPVKALLTHGLLNGKTFFDYGCGQGDDVQALRSAGIDASGWDPHFKSTEVKQRADVVNLGFVLNVIEDSRSVRRRCGMLGVLRIKCSS